MAAAQAAGTSRTTWLRRYSTDPALADEFMAFLRNAVFPARRRRGFSIDGAWLNAEKTEFIWIVSFPGDSADFAAAERAWEESEERADIFGGTPTYVVAKQLGEVSVIDTAQS